jgi:hypothetical protein
MAEISCAKCNAMTTRGGYAIWKIVVAILFFPIGLLILLTGRDPTRCSSCGFTWEA